MAVGLALAPSSGLCEELSACGAGVFVFFSRLTSKGYNVVFFMLYQYKILHHRVRVVS